MVQQSEVTVMSRFAPVLMMAIVFAVAGVLLLAITRATTGLVAVETEDIAAELVKSDDSASGSSYIEFNGTEPSDDPIAGHNGSVGCRANCESVGFQNLDGKDGFVLENKIISNPGGKCMSINNAKNITLKNITVENCATQVTLKGSSSGHNAIIPIIGSSNITIENSIFRNIARKESTKERNNLFAVENTNNFTFRNNEVKDLHNDLNAGGALGGGGSKDYGNRLFRLEKTLSNITIERNSFYNPGRNVLQIVRSTIPGFLFAHNRIEGRGEWDTDFEDILNFYASSGTVASPLVVRGNYIRDNGPSINGTTMALGDGGKTIQSKYMLIEDNVLLNPGKVGIAISGGSFFTVRNNIILSDIDLPHHLSPRIAEATGMHLIDFGYTPYCGDHTITNNRIWFKNKTQPGGVANAFFPRQATQYWKPCLTNVTISNTEEGDPTLTREEIWPF